MRSLNMLRVSGSFAVLALACTPTLVHAVPQFPRDIQRDLSLDYEPPCGICHLKNNTGVGTANTPFALALRERGLDAGQRASLATTLTKLDADKLDSDGDGTDDVDELRTGTDPNSEAPVSIRNQPEPEWGCAMPTTPQPRAAGLSVGLMLALVGLGWARRRR